MKIILLKVLIILLLISSLNGSLFCNEKDTNVSKPHRTIKAVGDMDFPPFEFINKKGEPDGFNVDVFKAIMEELELDYDIKLLQWTDAISLLKSGSVDAITGMGVINRRLDEFNFVAPNTYLYYTIVKRKNSNINTIKDLNNKNIILQEDLIIDDQVKDLLSSSNLFYVTSNVDALKLLSEGKHDAVICSDIIAEYHIGKNKFKNLEVTDLNVVAPIQFCIAVNKSDEDLRLLIDRGLGNIKAKGVYDKIYTKWFSDNNDSEFKKYFYISLIVLLVLVFIALIIVFIVRKYIARVTYNLNRSNIDLETSLLRIKLAIKASNLGQWDYDCETGVVTIYSESSLDFQSHEDLDFYITKTHPEDSNIITPIINRIKKKEDFNFSVDIKMQSNRSNDWEYICLDGTAVKNLKGDIIKYTGFRKNNTRFVKLSEQIKEQNIYIGMALQTGNIIPTLCDVINKKFYTSISKSINSSFDKEFNNADGIPFETMILRLGLNDRDRVRKEFNKLINGRTKLIHDEVLFNTIDGNTEYYEISFMGINYGKTGIPQKLVGYFQNITKRKLAEEELKSQQEFMSTVFDQIPIPIQIKDYDNEGKYVFWNKASEDLYGLGLFKTGEDLLDAEFYEDIKRIDRKVYESELPHTRYELLKLKNGKAFETLVHKRVIKMNGRKLILITRWDVSKEKELSRKSKVLSSSMLSLKAYNWQINVNTGYISYGEGFDDIANNKESMDSIEKFANIIHPKYKENFLESFNEFFKKDDGSITLEYEIDLNGDGNYEWWECRGIIDKEKTEDGIEIKYIYGIDINIDSHKKVESELIESKNKLNSLIKQNELILNNSNTGLVFLDKNFVIQWENFSSYKIMIPNLLKYKKGFVCYKSVHGYDEPCPDCIIQKCVNRKTPVTKEVVYDGVISELTAIPIYNNDELIGTVLKTIDITEIKRINTELKEAKERAEFARLKAEESNKLKSAFLANMSHEIRTPLNAIVGFSNLIATAETDEEKLEFSNIINTNNDLLLRLIGDILDLSKIEAGMMKLKPEIFNITDVFNSLYLSLSQRVVNPEVEFILDIPNDNREVFLDKNRLLQIVTNFANNAIKFTPKGYIKMGYAFLSDDTLRVYVEDTGIGIAKDKTHKVFERFEKLDDFAQGTGLGMAICKAIIDASGGDIGVESELGKGSIFWATIKLTEAPN